VSFRFRVLGSGSSGNATLVEADGTRILIDAGLGSRELGERLESAGVDPASLAALFLSHEHVDHAKGAAAFSRKWGVPIRGTRGTYAAAGLGAEKIAGYDVMRGGAPVWIGRVSVLGVPVPHDAAEPLAFVVSCQGRSLGHATDFGHFTRGFVRAFQECQAVLVESNYDPTMLRDGAYPWSVKERILGPLGHVSNGDVGRYLGEGLGPSCRSVLLAHISRQNNHPELALMMAEIALRDRGRRDVGLELTGPEGTGWIEVPAAAETAQKHRGQLRLF
jgi:phosphoribosyl 1,2-cyclic phosphodiesterase